MTALQSALPLREWYVMSLRPVAGHDPVRRAAQRLGARVFALSTLHLQALDAGAALAPALRAGRVIFTSPAAVRYCPVHVLPRANRGQHYFAVGSATARALQRCGCSAVHWPTEQQNSEGLLALPELQSLANTDVGLVTAPGGRDLIEATLTRRGARVHRAEVYRRLPLRPRAARLRALLDLPEPAALLVTSGEAFAVLWQALNAEQQCRLRHRLAIASSARLHELLAAHGFGQVLRAAGASPSEQLAALAAHVERGGVPVR